MALIISKTKNKKENTENIVLIADTEKQFIYLDKDENTKNTIKEVETDKAMPVLDIKAIKTFRILISGSSGSGKTYMAESILEQLKSKNVYLFSSIDDGDYKEFNVKRIDLNNIIEKSKFDIHAIFEMIEDNAILIFDDIISYGKKLSKVYIELRLIALQKGRHRNISVIIVEQQALTGNAYREVMLNCNYFILFPKNNFRSFNAIATNYLGLQKSKIDELLTLNTRYIFISKNYPAYYVSSNKVGIL